MSSFGEKNTRYPQFYLKCPAAEQKAVKIGAVKTTAPNFQAAPQPNGAAGDSWPDDSLALRLRKPGWRDPRLITGLVLMALGIGLGSLIVNAASNTVSVYAAAGPLLEGSALEPGNLVTKEVRIPDYESHYLAPEITDTDWWQDQPHLTRPIAAGELVPLAALTNAPNSSLRPVTISVAAGSEHGLTVGGTVDLWHVSDTNSDAEPRLLAEGLQVSAISEDSGPLSIAGSKAVTVLVPLADLKVVLDAKSSAGAVELVQHLGGSRP